MPQGLEGHVCLVVGDGRRQEIAGNNGAQRRRHSTATRGAVPAQRLVERRRTQAVRQVRSSSTNPRPRAQPSVGEFALRLTAERQRRRFILEPYSRWYGAAACRFAAVAERPEEKDSQHRPVTRKKKNLRRGPPRSPGCRIRRSPPSPSRTRRHPGATQALCSRMIAAPPPANSPPAKKPNPEPEQRVCFFCDALKTCKTTLAMWSLEAAIRDRVPCHGDDGLATAADRNAACYVCDNRGDYGKSCRETAQQS